MSDDHEAVQNNKVNKAKKNSSLPPMKLKLKGKPGRGSISPDLVIELMTQNWQDIKNSLENLEEGTKAQIQEFFNNIDEDYDTLGNELFGDDPSEFATTIGRMD